MSLVLKKLGLEGRAGAPADLAKIIGMPPYSEGSISLVRRWIRGAHGPSFDYTMAMLSAAGLLAPEADRAWKGIESDPMQAARDAAVAAAEAEEGSERAARSVRRRPKRATG